jgi:hypothetical protein
MMRSLAHKGGYELILFNHKVAQLFKVMTLNYAPPSFTRPLGMKSWGPLAQ